jgi:hypothetical protein
MTLFDGCRVWLLGIALIAAGPGIASAEEAKPFADERCVARCDDASDRCMAKADSEEKAQKCDDEYSECLEKCR